ncbi:MAG: hypothetical protein KA146_09775 [Leptospiraceae bacterium]|nr:hypothetical protein [Leptospiraceae bacterium]
MSRNFKWLSKNYEDMAKSGTYTHRTFLQYLYAVIGSAKLHGGNLADVETFCNTFFPDEFQNISKAQLEHLWNNVVKQMNGNVWVEKKGFEKTITEKAFELRMKDGFTESCDPNKVKLLKDYSLSNTMLKTYTEGIQRVLFQIAHLFEEQGFSTVYVSHRQLSEHARCSYQTAFRAIEAFLKSGLLVREKNGFFCTAEEQLLPSVYSIGKIPEFAINPDPYDPFLWFGNLYKGDEFYNNEFKIMQYVSTKPRTANEIKNHLGLLRKSKLVSNLLELGLLSYNFFESTYSFANVSKEEFDRIFSERDTSFLKKKKVKESMKNDARFLVLELSKLGLIHDDKKKVASISEVSNAFIDSLQNAIDQKKPVAKSFVLQRKLSKSICFRKLYTQERRALRYSQDRAMRLFGVDSFKWRKELENKVRFALFESSGMGHILA